MQAYIKDNKLIVNTMIQNDEIEDLQQYIEKASNNGVTPITLYNVEGEKSGIAFKINDKEDK